MLNGIRHKLTTYFSPEVQKQINPQSYAETGGQKDTFFGTKQKDRAKLNDLIRIYECGGMISEAIDLYPLFMFSKGYTFEGDKSSIKTCTDFMDGFDFQIAFNLAITSPLVCRDGYQEILEGRGKTKVGLLYRNPVNWVANYDQAGIVSGYTQTINTGVIFNKEKTFEPNAIFHTQMIPSLREGAGTSLIDRAIDEIKRDAMIAQGTANAIERHGTPKWWARVGISGKPVASSILDAICRKLEDLNSKNDIATQYDTDIRPLDTGGVGNIQAYQEFSLVRLTGAMGIPGELLGFRQGSSDNTAVSRIGAFLQKCDTFNQRFARSLNVQVFDQVTGKSGAAKIKFNSVMPSQQAEQAAWIINLIKANPLDPEAYVPTQWVKETLGIPDTMEQTTRANESCGCGEFKRRIV